MCPYISHTLSDKLYEILTCNVFIYRLSQFQTPTLFWCLSTPEVEEGRVKGKQLNMFVHLSFTVIKVTKFWI